MIHHRPRRFFTSDLMVHSREGPFPPFSLSIRVRSVRTDAGFCQRRPLSGREWRLLLLLLLLCCAQMVSTRMKTSECLNGEGMHSVHLSDGILLLYHSGFDYEAIYPTWDWNLIPGISVD
jgi:hypothetical protein